jgi:hypothetical protein
MLQSVRPATVVFLAALGTVACDADNDAADFEKAEEGKADSSVEATIMEFEFDGELETDWVVSADRVVRDQLLYTIGHLNGNRSVGRLDRLELSNLQTSTLPTGRTLIRYHARMPVAWGSKTNLPASYDFILPRDVSFSGLEAFTTRYKDRCIDVGAHDVTSGSMWYYYRPRASGCALTDADVVRSTASAVVSTVNTTGKFPEYHLVWEDQELKVVAIFGKYEDGATTSADAGIAAYNQFVGAVRTRLAGYSPTTIPATVPTSPGVATPDVTFRASIGGGRSIEVVALLVDNVRTAGPTFDARYEELSTDADVIAYNGHAGLGSNVRALARKGRWVAGKYVVVFMNGCDTYAYVDGSLAETRAVINPDDPTGTKYMEFVVNAMPSYFHSDSGATMALLSGLLDHAAPKTYEQMFRSVDRAQVVLVTGEHDNVYVPGFGGGGGGGGGEFTPLREVTSVAQGQTLAFETGAAPAGTYVVRLAHDAAHGGGDADLYVRVGQAPTTTAYDCRPWLSGSAEECSVTVSAPATIHAHVAGYAAGDSHFVLTIERVGVLPGPTWGGIDESMTVARAEEKRWQTPSLPPGRYSFTLSGAGDADLYVRTGTAPTTTVYDCRPYRSGSSETCVVSLASPAPVHVMVRGYASSSSVKLVGKKD